MVGDKGKLEAGKSTLIKTITGAIKPNEGKVIYQDKEYTELNQILSGKIEIEAIYQEFNLAPSLKVKENIYMGSRANNGIFIDQKKLVASTIEILESLQADIHPDTKISDLTVAYMLPER